MRFISFIGFRVFSIVHFWLRLTAAEGRKAHTGSAVQTLETSATTLFVEHPVLSLKFGVQVQGCSLGFS